MSFFCASPLNVQLSAVQPLPRLWSHLKEVGLRKWFVQWTGGNYMDSSLLNSSHLHVALSARAHFFMDDLKRVNKPILD